ncbi:hypothetical protein AGMMS50229_00240 [Campylobacterota bacterium]|nr:hypothetical protein AGMMS50229_00240 [Campylobacterota bacterium]
MNYFLFRSDRIFFAISSAATAKIAFICDLTIDPDAQIIYFNKLFDRVNMALKHCLFLKGYSSLLFVPEVQEELDIEDSAWRNMPHILQQTLYKQTAFLENKTVVLFDHQRLLK